MHKLLLVPRLDQGLGVGCAQNVRKHEHLPADFDRRLGSEGAWKACKRERLRPDFLRGWLVGGRGELKKGAREAGFHSGVGVGGCVGSVQE